MPTAREETDPWESPGAPSRLGRFALVAWRLVRDVCPEGRPDRCRSPCHAHVAEERRPLQAPVPPGLRATAFRDWGAARLVVACLGGGAACPLCAEGHEEARSKDGPGPWQGGKPGAVRRGMGPRCTGHVAVGQGVPGHAELGDQGVPQAGSGGEHACLRGQGHRGREGLQAGRDDGGRAPGRGTGKTLQGGATGELGGWQSRPAAEAVAQERGIVVLQPLQDGGGRSV